MSGLTQAVRSFRNIWSHGDEEFQDDDADYTDDQSETAPPSQAASRPANTSYAPQPSYGGGSGTVGSGVKRLRSVAPSPLRAHEKNIYTLRPKTQEDAAIAADALKAGDAVIINLEELDRSKAVRIIDFMSGVCYGLEGQGHAMKLGDLIFLYTPPEFEITSDETDYGENPDFFFRDVEHSNNATVSNSATNSATVQSVSAPTVSSAALNAPISAGRATPGSMQAPTLSTSSTQSSNPTVPNAGQPLPQQQGFSPQSYGGAERRPWER